MVMGRPTKPAEIKRRLGTARPDRQKAPISLLPAASKAPAVPKGLGRSGKAAWRRYWALGAAWLSPSTDLEIITRLCQGYDERQKLRDILAAEGLVATGSMGQTVAHPAVAMLRQIEAQLTRWESLCGFTPSDRSRLGMAEVQRVSKLDQFLAGRRRAAES